MINENYFNVLKSKIAFLIEKRRNLTDLKEIDAINEKLTKLYDIKFTMLAQMHKQ